MRLYTVYYISVNCSLYMFRVVTPPIIRSTYNCNHNIWHWSNRLSYVPLSWSNCSTTTEGSSDGLNSARCYDYSYMCSWWWVELPPETRRASSLQKYNKLYIVASRWTVIHICCIFFFWVIPRRLNFMCRRFGTLFHLHRQVGV